MANPVLVIMAAGMGSRYGGLKQIDPIGPNGQILLDYSIYDAHRAGFDRVVFIIRPELHEAFEDAIGKKARRFMQVDYAYQTLDNLPDGLTAPEGYVYVPVKIGVSDDDYTQIISGVTGNDTVAYDPSSVSTDDYYDDGSSVMIF